MQNCKSKSIIKTNLKSKEKIKTITELPVINPFAAGVDIGSRSHYVAFPNNKGQIIIKEYGTCTEDLKALIKDLKKNKVNSVAMESTGIYWIPFYELLERSGIEAVLVNASHVKNVSGRKSDVKDCEWIQKLHSVGLLQGAFRPKQDVLKLRTLLRHRQTLIRHQSPHVLHMQKALMSMNIQLHHAVSDILGLTGMNIVKAILNGERNSDKLAELRDPRCHNSKEAIARALNGDYKDEQLYILKQSLELYEDYQRYIHGCDDELKKLLSSFDDKISADQAKTSTEIVKKKTKKIKNGFNFEVSTLIQQKTGVNLFAIPSFNNTLMLTVVSEIGLNVDSWRTAKHFTSWLALAPRNKKSGGKVLSSSTARKKNRLAQALKFAAVTLRKSQTYLGAQYRRFVSRLGEAKAIAIMARKLAEILYNMLKYGQSFVELGIEKHEKDHLDRQAKNLKRKAKELGFQLVPVK